MTTHLRSKDPIIRADQVLQRKAERAKAAIERRDKRDWAKLLERVARKAVYKERLAMGYPRHIARQIATEMPRASLPKACEDCTQMPCVCPCKGRSWLGAECIHVKGHEGKCRGGWREPRQRP